MAERLGTQLQSGGLEQSIHTGLLGSGLFGGASLDLNFAVTKNVGPLVSFTRASSATYIDSAGTLQTAATDVPRFDHNPTTGESLGLLVEEARTNSIRNNTMQGAVAGTPGTLPTNWARAASPTNGISFQVVGTGTESGVIYLDLRFTGTCSATFGFSVDTDTSSAAAAATGQAWTSSVYLTRSAGTIGNATVQLVLNEYSSVPAFLRNTFSSSVVPAASNLATQRITQTVTAGASTAFVQQSLSVNFTNGNTYDFTLRIGLPQLELGAFATSVIPTTTAAATRSADVASITGANFSSWYRQDEGTVFASSTLISSSYINGVLWDVGAGGAFGTTAYGAWSGTQWTLNPNSAPLNMFSAVTAPAQSASAYALKANDSSIAAAGLIGTLDAACAMPASATTLSIGKAGWTAGNYLNGTIRRLTFFPQRLPNSTLQAITQ